MTLPELKCGGRGRRKTGTWIAEDNLQMDLGLSGGKKRKQGSSSRLRPQGWHRTGHQRWDRLKRALSPEC